MEMVSPDNMPEFITTEVEGRFGGDVQAYVDWLYDNSIYANREKLESYPAGGRELPADDPALMVFNTTVAKHNGLVEQLREPAMQFARRGTNSISRDCLRWMPTASTIPTPTSPSVSPTAT